MSSHRAWIGEVLISVVLYITGLLCLSQARRLSPKEDSVPLGTTASIVFAFVAAVIAAVVIAVSRTRRDAFANIVLSSDKSSGTLPWLLAFAALFFAGNAAFFEAVGRAPNPGYAAALSTLQVAGVALASAWLFNDSLTPRNLGGIGLVVLGAVLVSVPTGEKT